MEALYQLSYSPKGNGVRYQGPVVHHNGQPNRVLVNFYRRVVVNSSRDRGGGRGPVDPWSVHVEALDFVELAD
jgi:hypothetical protein